MDEKVIIGKRTAYPLDGILSIPNESQHRFPAVLLVHGSGPSDKDETIEDAILAASLLKSDIRINPDKVFVIGHSLGGMLAPRIDAEGGNFAGIIIMAGSPRNLGEIMLSQNEDSIRQLNKLLQKIAVKQVASLKAKFNAISVMSDDEAQRKKYLTIFMRGISRKWKSTLLSIILKQLQNPY